MVIMSEEEKFSLDDGKRLIKFVRENIHAFLNTGKRIPVPDDLKEMFGEKYGAFVTLNKYSNTQNPLRGCIGYIEPKFPLYDVLHRVSVSAACEDPRFPAVSLKEMENITIEISILTPPELIEVDNPEDYIKEIEIGKHGLIVERGPRRGLLLPQVPVDHDRNWDEKTFLEHTCQKAWLPKDAWKEKNTEIYRFSAILFEEEEPKGEVKRKYIQK
ncbi:MAG: hypothetical protein BAJALOKI2v1_970002 [Promethearchaeota archaeon]|nr:MAG: hypothetical protein BAJALOKI2v1_970002 [Candidatus Lokiarchaeota archaeon]